MNIRVSYTCLNCTYKKLVDVKKMSPAHCDKVAGWQILYVSICWEHLLERLGSVNPCVQCIRLCRLAEVSR